MRRPPAASPPEGNEGNEGSEGNEGNDETASSKPTWAMGEGEGEGDG